MSRSLKKKCYLLCPAPRTGKHCPLHCRKSFKHEIVRGSRPHDFKCNKSVLEIEVVPGPNFEEAGKKFLLAWNKWKEDCEKKMNGKMNEKVNELMIEKIKT